LAVLSIVASTLAIPLAFLPYGWGVVTVGSAVFSLVCALFAVDFGARRLGRFAVGWALVAPGSFCAFMGFMVPKTTSIHTVSARVTLVGTLPDQSIFNPEVVAGGPVEGVVMVVEPCGVELVYRTTQTMSSHTQVMEPPNASRACLLAFEVGDAVSLKMEITRRWSTGEVRSYRIETAGDCDLEGAYASGGQCPAWWELNR